MLTVVYIEKSMPCDITSENGAALGKNGRWMVWLPFDPWSGFLGLLTAPVFL